MAYERVGSDILEAQIVLCT